MLISKLVPLWLDNTLYLISVLLNLLRLFMAQHMFCPGDCSVCAWKSIAGCCRAECSIDADFLSSCSFSYWGRILKSPAVIEFSVSPFNSLCHFNNFFVLTKLPHTPPPHPTPKKHQKNKTLKRKWRNPTRKSWVRKYGSVSNLSLNC